MIMLMFENYSCHKHNRRTCTAISSPLLTRRETVFLFWETRAVFNMASKTSGHPWAKSPSGGLSVSYVKQISLLLCNWL